MRVPVYRLKLVRSSWIASPQVDLRHPQLAAFYLHKLIGKAAVEHAAAIFLDPVHQVVGSTVFGVGDVGSVAMVGREVFKAAICANASAVILGHNHPAPSTSQPSAADVRVTERLIKAGAMLGIAVIDHVIVTPSERDFTSMRETAPLALSWSVLPTPRLAL